MSRNLLHLIFFLILIFGVSLFFSLCYNKKSCSYSETYLMNKIVTPNTGLYDSSPITVLSTSNPIYKISLISDTHENSEIFLKLQESLSKENPSLLLHLGDVTNYGTKDSFKTAKADLNTLNIKYYVFPGDHDIAETSSLENFNSFFSFPKTLEFSEFSILYIPNFYNFTPLSDEDFDFVISNINSSEIIISSQPIFVNEDNIFFNKFMGSEAAFENLTLTQSQNLTKYNNQRIRILDEIRKTSVPKFIISGDHHRSSNFYDPINPQVSYHILGSLAKYIEFGNSKILQTSLQSNRYSILEVYKEDNAAITFKIREIELK